MVCVVSVYGIRGRDEDKCALNKQNKKDSFTEAREVHNRRQKYLTSVFTLKYVRWYDNILII
jgi:hypothetical protein